MTGVAEESACTVGSGRLWFRSHYLIVVSIVCLAAIAFGEQLQAGTLQNIIVGVGFFGLVFVSGVLLVTLRPRSTSVVELSDEQSPVDTTARWRSVIAGLGILGVLIAQTWFQAGTMIAGGDITPPVGTAWIGRLFANTGWNGSSLGGPVANETQLPFAVLDEVVHMLGGSGALAQRLWFTILIAAILTSGAILARSLRMSPMTGLITGLVFFFNPLTMSLVGPNDVFLLAMVLTASLPALVIAYGTGALTRWRLVLGFALAAPFVGFVFQNPPLVGMLGIIVLVTPVLVWARFGTTRARQALMGALIGGLVCGAVSSYWLVPQALAISTVAVGSVSSLNSLSFTYARSTLANALWLNNTWGWSFAEYYPYTHYFREIPLELVRSLIPILSFGSLVVVGLDSRTRLDTGVRRLVGVMCLLVLAVMFISLGIRYPGAIVFDVLFKLPEGWLLQDPQRFIIAAALGCALLIGVSVEGSLNWLRGKLEARTRAPRHAGTVVTVGGLSLVALIAVGGSFPLVTGTVIPDARPDLPSSHVAMPQYWQRMFRFLNSQHSPAGSLLTLPVDDFYQMPYRWYYGNDGFIVNALRRHVLDVIGGEYSKVSNELRSAVVDEQGALLSGNVVEASRLLDALNAPLVVVRGDIVSSTPGRSIADPTLLNQAILRDPRMKLVRSFGPLVIYRLRNEFRTPADNYATAETSHPNLEALGRLPSYMSIVDSPPVSGHYAIVSLPPINQWQVKGDVATTKISLPSPERWSVSMPIGIDVHMLGSKAVSNRISNLEEVGAGLSFRLGRSLLSNGSFTGGTWTSVANCNEVGNRVLPQGDLKESVRRHGGPEGSGALELSATTDTACVWRTVKQVQGSVLLSFDARSLAGSAPAMCLWEEPAGICGATSVSLGPVQKGGWRQYRYDIKPLNGTKSLALYLYAQAMGSGGTIDEYANVACRSVLAREGRLAGGLAVVAVPRKSVNGGSKGGASYGSYRLTRGSKSVLVDGLRRGGIKGGKVVVSGPAVLRIVEAEAVVIVILGGLAFVLSLAETRWLRAARS